jgi:hypothetical protein
VTVPDPPPHLTPPRTTRRHFGGRWTAFRGGRELARATRLVGPALIQVRAHLQEAEPWVESPGTWTSTGTGCFPLGVRGEVPVALMRLSPTGGDRLSRESGVLARLAQAPLPEALRAVLPQRLATGEIRGCTYVVDRMLPGQSGERFAGEPEWTAVERSALTRLGELHQATASARVVDEALLQDWVHAPLTVLRPIVERLPHGSSGRLDEVRDQLIGALTGQAVRAVWVHGDLWPGNLLVDPGTQQVTGIVDWDLAGPDELPVHDYLHVLLSRRRVASGAQMGEVVSEVLSGRAPLTPEERRELARSYWCFPAGAPPLQVLLLLYWLRYVATISLQQNSYVTHSVRIWQRRNVHRVLKQV